MEFALVAALLTVLTLTVVQLGFALYVRNTVLDAAAEGARFGSLADTSIREGAGRTRQLITAALGAGYARDIRVGVENYQGYRCARITVLTPLPLIGLLGFDGGLEVTGHAAIETAN